MSYEFIPRNLVKPNETGYGIDFNSKYNGIFGTLYDINKQALSNLKNLLLTRKGERYHNVLFGSDLSKIIFEPNVSELKEDIDAIIRNAVSNWLPYINIEQIDIVTAEDDIILDHNVKITISFSVDSNDPAILNKIIIFANENGVLTVETL